MRPLPPSLPRSAADDVTCTPPHTSLPGSAADDVTWRLQRVTHHGLIYFLLIS